MDERTNNTVDLDDLNGVFDMYRLNARQKSDAIFRWADVIMGDGSGKLELEEFRKLTMATNDGMSEDDARVSMDKETWTEKVMPLLGGGTALDKDQLYKSYCGMTGGGVRYGECKDIDDDFNAVFKFATSGKDITGRPLTNREKTDAIFDSFDVDKSGKIEISEMWRAMTLSHYGVTTEEAVEMIPLEAFMEQMMPMLGGGTAVDKDQFYKTYTIEPFANDPEYPEEEIHRDYEAMMIRRLLEEGKKFQIEFWLYQSLFSMPPGASEPVYIPNNVLIRTWIYSWMTFGDLKRRIDAILSQSDKWDKDGKERGKYCCCICPCTSVAAYPNDLSEIMTGSKKSLRYEDGDSVWGMERLTDTPDDHPSQVRFVGLTKYWGKNLAYMEEGETCRFDDDFHWDSDAEHVSIIKALDPYPPVVAGYGSWCDGQIMPPEMEADIERVKEEFAQMF